MLMMSFRLLTEYHSFLFITHEWLITFDVIPAFPSPYGVSFILMSYVNMLENKKVMMSFRLLMEYHSFLFYKG